MEGEVGEGVGAAGVATAVAVEKTAGRCGEAEVEGEEEGTGTGVAKGAALAAGWEGGDGGGRVYDCDAKSSVWLSVRDQERGVEHAGRIGLKADGHVAGAKATLD